MNWTQDQLNLALKSNADIGVDLNTDVGAATITNIAKKPSTQKELPLVTEELFLRRLEYRERVLLESVIQSQFVQWVRKHKAFYIQLASGFAVPNGGKRPMKTAKTMRAEGQEPGVPDYMFLYPAKTYAGLIIETKTKYNQPTDGQKEWLNRLVENGFYCCVCWSKRDMIELVTWFYDLPEGLPGD